MVFGCAAKTTQLVVFFVNFLAFVAGLVILITSISALKNSDFYGELVKYANGEDSLRFVLCVGIVLGALLILLGFLGCCGAFFESECLLCLFSTVLIVIILAQIFAGVFVFVEKDKVNNLIEGAMNKTSQNLTEPGICDMWDNIQTKLECCGLTGEPLSAPSSCAKVGNCKPDSLKHGCVNAMESYITGNNTPIAVALLIFVLVELAAVLLACCLRSDIKNSGGYRNYA